MAIKELFDVQPKPTFLSRYCTHESYYTNGLDSPARTSSQMGPSPTEPAVVPLLAPTAKELDLQLINLRPLPYAVIEAIRSSFRDGSKDSQLKLPNFDTERRIMSRTTGHDSVRNIVTNFSVFP